jgi:signal transduction histidine kinase
MGNVTDEGKRKKFLGAIIKESDRLSRLTDRALYFIRYGQGALRYQFTEGDLGGVVKEVVESFAVGVGGQVAVAGAGSRVSEDEKAQIVLGIKIAPDLPPVRFDVGAMEQVLYNLLDNALKYSRKEEAVQIRVELVVEAGHVVLSVQDQGVGMSPDEVRRILKPYVRGRNAGRQNARGIGLGLALCQHVVQAHGGRIQIHSEPGKGSKFCILLPG